VPSPAAHAIMGYAVYRCWLPRRLPGLPTDGFVPPLLLATLVLSMLPDLDAIPGILLADLGRYHNNMTNSVVFGLAASTLLASAVWLFRREGFRDWFTLTLTCYMLHLAMDFFTHGRGLMLLWPFSDARFHPPFELFYGLRWSDGLISVRHVWTLASEVGTALIVAVPVLLWQRRRNARAGVR